MNSVAIECKHNDKILQLLSYPFRQEIMHGYCYRAIGMDKDDNKYLIFWKVSDEDVIEHYTKENSTHDFWINPSEIYPCPFVASKY